MPEFAVTILFLKRAVAASYSESGRSFQYKKNSIYSTVLPQDAPLGLCTAIQFPRHFVDTGAPVRFSKFPLAYSSSFDHTSSCASPLLMPQIRFINGAYLLGSATSIFSVTSIKFFYKQWVYEVGRVLYFFLFIKIKYKGKSYKWFKKNTAIILRFGYSHIALTQIPNFFFSKRIGKMKLVFFGTSSFDLHSFLSNVIIWRPMNIYNGRGLRFAKQLVFRKFGKVSAYR